VVDEPISELGAIASDIVSFMGNHFLKGGKRYCDDEDERPKSQLTDDETA